MNSQCAVLKNYTNLRNLLNLPLSLRLDTMYGLNAIKTTFRRPIFLSSIYSKR